MSEMELSMFRQRSLEALQPEGAAWRALLDRRGRLPARRARPYREGSGPAGPRGHRSGVPQVRRVQTVRQVHLWLRQEEIRLPAVEQGRGRAADRMEIAGLQHGPPSADQPDLRWRLCFRPNRQPGEHRGRAQADRARLSPGQSDWEVLIPDHHEGYISWEEFERNQRLIADNANGKGLMARARSVAAMRCWQVCSAAAIAGGDCTSPTAAQTGAGGYHCRGAHLNHGTERCIAFGGMRVDRGRMAVMLGCSPSGIEAAFAAIDARAPKSGEHRQAELALDQARYEAGRRGGNMTPSIQITGLSPANWSGAGTNASWRHEHSRTSVTRWLRCRMPR